MATSTFFPNFKEQTVAVSPDINIFTVTGGQGPALLLLHGFPQSHHIFHKVAPNLSKDYTIVCPDIRGYGASSKPAGDANHSQYAKSAMAKDMKSLMTKLGHETFFVCAHDRGARVAHKLCVDYPESVKKAIFLDIAPTLAMYSATNQEFATAYFHWFFLLQKSPFPELTITQNARQFAEHFMGGRYGGLKVFHPEALDYYVAVMQQQDAVHAMCEDYRASADIDMQEAREDLAAGRKIKCPLRVLWGSHGVIEKCFDALKEWRAVSDAEVEGRSVDSGHYIPEEIPDVLEKDIREFLV